MAKQPHIEKAATSSDWDQLLADPQLTVAWTDFAQAVSLSQYAADKRARELGVSPSDTIDLSAAGRVLDAYPQLVKYLSAVAQRESARLSAIGMSDAELLHKSNSPTGASRGDTSFGGLAWGGNRNNPIGVSHARKLRDWADSDEWVTAALNFLAEKVSRADIAVAPLDERKTYNRKVEKDIQLLLDQPNELRDTWPMLAGMWTRDLLTLGQGVFTKNMTPARTPMALYAEDAANIKIYPAWSGDPDEPRYLYVEGGATQFSRKVPLRNDEAIVAFYHPTTYRFGMGPVQTLADTIAADLAATQAAMHLVDFRPPPQVIQLEGATDMQIKALRANYEAEIQGRREIMFLGGGKASHFPLVFSAKDNQWLEWQEYLSRKIAAVFAISPADIGITSDVNRATATSQQEISDAKGFIPLLLMLEEYLNRELLADFAPKMAMERRDLGKLNLRIIFPEVSEAARMHHAELMIDIATKGLQGLPSFTLNQLLMLRGEEPVEGGNTFWVMTANGPMPWLSYDGSTGDYVSPATTAGDQGAQDAGGGVVADESSDDDMGSADDGEGSSDTSADTLGGSSDTGGSGDTGGGGESTTASLKNTIRVKFNENHGPDGRFATGDGSEEGGGAGGGSLSSTLEQVMANSKTLAEGTRNVNIAYEVSREQGDLYLKRIVDENGKSGTPTLIAKAEMDTLIANGALEAFRGESDAVYAETFKTGDWRLGTGTHGNGTYIGVGENAYSMALGYTRGADGGLMRIAIPANISIVEKSDIVQFSKAEYEKYTALVKQEAALAQVSGDWTKTDYYNTLQQTATDWGRTAAAMGYDAIRVPEQNTIVILNRSILHVQNEPVTKPGG
jgi:phage portal protein BeeE